MEGKYIFAIVVLGIFFLLIFVAFVVLERGRIKDEKLQAWISERYNSKEVNKYDYDRVDEEEEIPSAQAEAVVDEEEAEEEPPVDLHLEDAYGKIDIEGIEEITGNYKGDK